MPAGPTRYALIAAVVAAGLGGATLAALPGARHAGRVHRRPPSARAVRENLTDWQAIQGAVSLRKDALRPNLTAFHRSFAAYIGLNELLQLHRGLRHRCAVAVTYLYDNLLDLHDAYTGEDWTALRRAVAREPSLEVCAPRRRPPRSRPRYVE